MCKPTPRCANRSQGRRNHAKRRRRLTIPKMHIDTPVFFLLVLVAMLFRWLTSAANKAAKKSNEETRRSTSAPRTNAPVPGPHEDTDEDRIRKFLEALGQPPGSRPPPVVQPRTDVPALPVAPGRPALRPFWAPQG